MNGPRDPATRRREVRETMAADDLEAADHLLTRVLDRWVEGFVDLARAIEGASRTDGEFLDLPIGQSCPASNRRNR